MKPGLLPRTASHRRFLRADLAGETYVAPAWLDRRSELLPSSNQGNTSQCAAYAMAGWLEWHRWKTLGLAEQIPPAKIYQRAKQLDGEPHEPGTTLDAVLQAALDLGYLPSAEGIREISTLAEVMQAVHRYGVVLGAFEVNEGWFAATPGGWLPNGGAKVGGHAVLICAYDTGVPQFVGLQNSWGEGQGWRGFNRLTFAEFNEQFLYGLTWH